MEFKEKDWTSLVEKQCEMERRLQAMAATIADLEARVAELIRTQTAQQAEVAQISASAELQDASQVTPEIVATLTAAATAFVGKKARVRSAQPAAQNGSVAWAQQGRVNVQTSHKLR